MLSVLRVDEDAFSPGEVELIGLLGRLVAGAAHNLRSYELERRAVEEHRRLSSLRADFVSLVSHELRTPMAALVGAAMTVRDRWRVLAEEQREALLALIVAETERLSSLVSDVLDTSRLEAGTFTYRFGRVDLEGLLTEATAAAGLAQTEVPVVLQVPQHLPAVEGDPERLRQVLSNLIDNAVKYSPAGEPVEVRARLDDGRVVVSVADHGPGIAAENQQLVFEKFGRILGPTAKPGSGLGLYIARTIAEAHGGELAVESAPGQGATFTLTLPNGARPAG
jgi:signal transduction histidine kinase